MPDRALTFGRYRLEPRRGLTSGAREVRLTPKALALLSFLAERPGEVVTKDELFAAVWPETTVGDAALVTCIQELRRALRDDARRPRYIETLHRRGYRFIGKANAGANGEKPALPLPDRPSIAVLPFANMSGDPDQEYLRRRDSEDLITGLARIRWLFVIARNSTFVYKDRAVDVKEVSRSLGVRYVLEGSVRRAGRALARQRAADRRDRPAAIIGRNVTIARSATFSPCRTRSRAASRRRSSRTCWRQKGVRAFARSPHDSWRLGTGRAGADHVSGA